MSEDAGDFEGQPRQPTDWHVVAACAYILAAAVLPAAANAHQLRFGKLVLCACITSWLWVVWISQSQLARRWRPAWDVALGALAPLPIASVVGASALGSVLAALSGAGLAGALTLLIARIDGRFRAD